MAASSSFTFSNHATLHSLPHRNTLLIKTQHSVPTKSSESNFFGFRLSHSTSLSPLSSYSLKSSISAKVNKGQAAPNFTLKDQNGKPVSLYKYKGKPVVVYFYPADETPAATIDHSKTHNCVNQMKGRAS